MKTWKIIVLAAIVVVIDQITKFIVVSTMQIQQQIVVIPNFFSLFFIRNTGAAFSLFEGAQWFFYLTTVIALCLFVYFIKEIGDLNIWTGIGLGMAVGGMFGNFIDRLLFGSVVDFFKFVFGGYNFAIFNVADIGLTVGIGLVVIGLIVSEMKKKKTVAE
ncbi:signal peptidase II [Culicoidibacter larvae]|uniref:Lipoprotein signal peptidase n=1 Tax=Culicoidibacter larvae TaxID=2579976 RepID=A0A5R8QF00_9FIRM|nr:signal peptidase II [Culicoidibacter larvae]TLG76611.1 signal peptidase II [Culicoidibacter larvae]